MDVVVLGQNLVMDVEVKNRVVDKSKFGVSLDFFLGQVDSSGNYSVPTGGFVLDLSGIKSVAPLAFYDRFKKGCSAHVTKIYADDLESVGNSSFFNAFTSQSRLEEARFGVYAVESTSAFNSVFYLSNKNAKIMFPRLRVISGDTAFASAFDGLDVNVDEVFPVLEEITGREAMRSFVSYKVGRTISLPSVKKITGANAYTSSMFGGVLSQNTVWLLPNVTEITGYVWRGSSSVSAEIHFASKNRALIEACDGYDYKWGFEGATVYFDL